MAEVLITLGVIGIIAAMTLPALVEKLNKQVFITKIKYTYSVLNNAFIMAQNDYGDPTTWDWGGDSRESIINNSKYACNKTIAKNKRLNCGALIFYDCWQIKADYPW